MKKLFIRNLIVLLISSPFAAFGSNAESLPEAGVLGANAFLYSEASSDYVPAATGENSSSKKRKTDEMIRKNLAKTKRNIRTKIIDRDVLRQKKDPNSMDNFYIAIADAMKIIEVITKNTNLITEMYEQYIYTHNAETEDQLFKKLEQTINATYDELHNVHEQIKSMTQTNREYKDKNKLCETTIANCRIRENLTGNLANKLKNEQNDFQRAIVDFKDYTKKRTERRLKMIKPDIVEDELEYLSQTPLRSAQQMSMFFSGDINQEIKTTYQAAITRYDTIRKIDLQVANIQQMFLDLALLVEHQGELFDNIESNLMEANSYLEAGNEALYDAIQTAKKIRKRRFQTIVIVTTTAVIVTVIFLV